VEFRRVRVTGALHGVDLYLPSGATLAVVGRSGAGKSTLAALVGRLRDPDGGLVLLDGVPVSELDDGELRRAVGYAFAEPVLPGATVADAIAYGRPDLGRDAVARAAALAGADGFVRRLPGGYDTPLAGLTLSGGETQRLGLARLLARDPAVLVLDDATASLDAATEATVAAAIRAAGAGRTRIVVTHRRGTAADADVVAWLADGRLRGFGRHEELLAEPEYRALFGGSAATGVPARVPAGARP